MADHGGQKPKLRYNDIGNQILLSGFFSPKGYSTLAESTVFGQKFLFFCWGNLLAESEVTPFLDPVGGGGGLGEESIELLSYLIRYS